MRRAFFSVGVILTVLGSTPCRAAESTREKPFAEVFAEWRQSIGKLRELSERFWLVDDNERPKVAAEYKKVVAQAQAVEPTVVAAAEKAYTAAPNRDAAVSNFMMSATADAITHDNYERAYRLAKLLIENKYKNPEIHNIAGTAAFYLNQFDDAREYLKIAEESGQLNDISKRAIGLVDKYEGYWAKEAELRQAEAQADDLPRVKLETSKGDITVELFENEAPNTVANFINLVEKKFYDGTKFHRVVAGFMAQGGDPQGTGAGGPGYTIPDECRQPDHRLHFRGSLSMAKEEAPDTGGSQFFLTFVPADHLNGKHTVFGRVIDGIDVLAKLERVQPGRSGSPPNADKILRATVLRKRDHAYTVTEAKPK